MRRLVLLCLAILLLALAACAAPAPTTAVPAATRTLTPRPTATPRPPTPTPTAAFTPSPTPDIRLMKTRRLLAAFAASAAKTADGFRLTLPSGEKVELQNVAEQNLTMEPQNWVENYNGGKILYEGKTEAGQEWRVVELETGEIALMWAQKTEVRMDAFPYWWWGLGAEGKAEVTVPGNGELQWLKVTRTDNKDDDGHYVWVDEEGNPVKLSELGYMYVEKIMPKQGKPMPTEMKLPVVELTDWQVQAVEANDGYEYVVREGKVWVDGKAVPVPETKSQVPPENLMLNTKDGQWYVGWRGIALWKVEGGRVVKYDRPVWWTELIKEKMGGYPSVFIAKMRKDPEVIGEMSYSEWLGKFFVGNEEVSLTGMVGGINSPTWNGNIMYVLPGFLMKGEAGEHGSLYALRLIQPFGDYIASFHIDRSDNVWVFSGKEGIEGGKPTLRIEVFKKAEVKSVPVLAVIVNNGDAFMGRQFADGSQVMTKEEATKKLGQMENALKMGYLGSDTVTILGWSQKVFVPEEILGK